MTSVVTQCVLAATALFQSFIASAEADTYRANLSTIGAVTKNTEDTETTRSPVAGLQVFFKPVNNDPEQAFDQHEFIQRASNLYLAVAPTDIETTTYNTYLSKTTTSNTYLSNTSVSVAYYQGDVFAKLGYVKGSGGIKDKDTSSNLGDLQSQSSSYAVGYYLFPLSQISLGVDKTRLSYRPSTIAIFFGKTALDDVTTKTSLTSKTLWHIGQQESLCFELSLRNIRHEDSNTNHNNETDVSLKYYPVPAGYAQLQLTRNQGEDKATIGNTSMLAGGYAFTPRLSLYAAYLNFITSGTKNDNHSVLVAGNYRF